MGQIIEHQGVVKSIQDNHLLVEIQQEVSCGECQLKGSCTASENSVKIIEVESNQKHYAIGDQVSLIGNTSMGLWAVFFAFVIPVILIVLALILGQFYLQNENLSAAISVILLILYFLILRLFREKLKSKLKFKIQ